MRTALLFALLVASAGCAVPADDGSASVTTTVPITTAPSTTPSPTATPTAPAWEGTAKCGFPKPGGTLLAHQDNDGQGTPPQTEALKVESASGGQVRFNLTTAHVKGPTAQRYVQVAEGGVVLVPATRTIHVHAELHATDAFSTADQDPYLTVSVGALAAGAYTLSVCLQETSGPQRAVSATRNLYANFTL